MSLNYTKWLKIPTHLNEKLRVYADERVPNVDDGSEGGNRLPLCHNKKTFKIEN